MASGDVDAAARLFGEVLESRRRSGAVEGLGFALLNLGEAQLRLGDRPSARASFAEACDAFARIGFRAHTAHALQGLAAVEAAEGSPHEAARLLGRARAELDELDWSDDDFDQTLATEVEADVRRALGDDAFAAAYEDGAERRQG